MLERERRGLPIVLHVHDELVVEVSVARGESALREVLEIMAAQPSWASGFPIEVEGFLVTRFLKKPPKGSAILTARNGRIVHD